MSAILSKNRRGVTLVELLIVISILLGLLALAVPAMRPAMESKQIRDAARAVNVYFSTARSRAIETGRPCGVLLERDSNLPQACITLRQVEVPPPYAGDLVGAVVRVLQSGAVVNVRIRDTDFSPKLLRPGDIIQLNYQGPTYTILQPVTSASDQFQLDAEGYFDFSPSDKVVDTNAASEWYQYITNKHLRIQTTSPVAALPWSSSVYSGRLAFTIFRQPVASSTPPLQLPGRTVVDLYYSGKEDTTVDRFGQGDLNTRIVFSPNGSVDWISYDSSNPQERATSSMYLLVGRRDRAVLDVGGTYVPQSEDGLDNLDDTTNLWVVISPQTGLITTSEVANVSSVPATQKLAKARQFAREQHRMGGQ